MLAQLIRFYFHLFSFYLVGGDLFACMVSAENSDVIVILVIL